jgi:hypothetical protein
MFSLPQNLNKNDKGSSDDDSSSDDSTGEKNKKKPLKSSMKKAKVLDSESEDEPDEYVVKNLDGSETTMLSTASGHFPKDFSNTKII